MSKIIGITKKSVDIIKNDGVINFVKRGAKYTYYRQFPEQKKQYLKDILFINGSALPHPARYRVEHQKEQLDAAGITADQVF